MYFLFTWYIFIYTHLDLPFTSPCCACRKVWPRPRLLVHKHPRVVNRTRCIRTMGKDASYWNVATRGYMSRKSNRFQDSFWLSICFISPFWTHHVRLGTPTGLHTPQNHSHIIKIYAISFLSFTRARTPTHLAAYRGLGGTREALELIITRALLYKIVRQ